LTHDADLTPSGQS